MNVVPADYNAATVSGALPLDFRDSKRVLSELNVHPGDWVWASDGEVLVGAQLEGEWDSGLVAIPRWETLVHLDDYQTSDFPRVWQELQQALQQPGRSVEEETRVFQLLMVFDAIAPPHIKAAVPPGYLSLRMAGALHFLGEPGLALVAIEDALRDRPDDPDVLFFYLETLRRTDVARAEREAQSWAARDDASAPVLAACINIWSAAADRLSDHEFAAVAAQVLGWMDHFERAPGRDRVRASVLAQVQFNRGLLMLRSGRSGEALDALNLAHATDPVEPSLDQARHLHQFDEKARELARSFRGKPLFIAA